MFFQLLCELECYILDFRLFVCILLFCILLIIILVQKIKIIKLKKYIKNIDNIAKKLYTVGDIISKISDEEKLLSIILDSVVELVPNADKGSILMRNEEDLYYFKAIKGYPDELKKIVLTKEEVFLYEENNFAEAAIIKKPLKVNQKLFKKEKVDKFNDIKALEISCIISAPIYLSDVLVGVINVDCIKPGVTFTVKDLGIMNFIKNELQLALKNSYIQKKLINMAHYDELTGLNNRRSFNEIFKFKLEEIKVTNEDICLAVIDLDDFKIINDTHGHSVGDKALRHFAETMTGKIRKSDMCARISGDEFVILFSSCKKQDAENKLSEIREELKIHLIQGECIKFSYGITTVDPKSDDLIDDIFIRADKEMYENKKFKTLRK